MMTGGGTGRGDNQDFDLNLAPIIDGFTVLIAFMLTSASFLSIGILSAGAGAAGQSPADTKPPAVALEVVLQEHFDIEFKLTGKKTINKTIPAKNGDLDLPSLQAELQGFKQQWPELASITVSAHNEVDYQHVVASMESARHVIPDILLGGF